MYIVVVVHPLSFGDVAQLQPDFLGTFAAVGKDERFDLSIDHAIYVLVEFLLFLLKFR